MKHSRLHAARREHHGSTSSTATTSWAAAALVAGLGMGLATPAVAAPESVTPVTEEPGQTPAEDQGRSPGDDDTTAPNGYTSGADEEVPEDLSDEFAENDGSDDATPDDAQQVPVPSLTAPGQTTAPTDPQTGGSNDTGGPDDAEGADEQPEDPEETAEPAEPTAPRPTDSPDTAPDTTPDTTSGEAEADPGEATGGPGEEAAQLSCTAQRSPMLSPGDHTTITLVTNSPDARVTFTDGSSAKTTIHRVTATLSKTGGSTYALTLDAPREVPQTSDDGVQLRVSDGSSSSACHASFTVLSGGEAGSDTDQQPAGTQSRSAEQGAEEPTSGSASGSDSTDGPTDGSTDDSADEDGRTASTSPAEETGDQQTPSDSATAEESPSEQSPEETESDERDENGGENGAENSSESADAQGPQEDIASTGTQNLIIGAAVLAVLALGAAALVAARQRHTR